jgi:hypothetical protein
VPQVSYHIDASQLSLLHRQRNRVAALGAPIATFITVWVTGWGSDGYKVLLFETPITTMSSGELALQI